MEILYCTDCGRRVRTDATGAEAAVHTSAGVFCKACAKGRGAEPVLDPASGTYRVRDSGPLKPLPRTDGPICYTQ